MRRLLDGHQGNRSSEDVHEEMQPWWRVRRVLTVMILPITMISLCGCRDDGSGILPNDVDADVEECHKEAKSCVAKSQIEYFFEREGAWLPWKT